MNELRVILILKLNENNAELVLFFLSVILSLYLTINYLVFKMLLKAKFA